ncbi:heparinase II/III domain-containing protein [Formosa algae]|uniref:heparinase II/III domain-containing protein n=1 Tax=Formosa algae TaxID=225843 RepID=UPI002936F772|nr:heparinase II/III family protein [Formosa algae]
MIKYNEMISEKPNFASRYMESLGDFYMRSSWEEDANYLSIHLKKMGAGHGHDNLLHFTLFSKGKDYLVDSGRYSYVDDQWRELFKSNKSHNTLGVDNLTNSIYSDSWTNSFEARSEGVFTKSNELYDYAEAENTAYKRLKDPVSVKRRVISLKSHVWLFFDSFSSNKQHRYSQYFNFPNDSIKKSK